MRTASGGCAAAHGSDAAISHGSSHVTTTLQVSDSLGVSDHYPLLASMLTNRPWGDVVGKGAASTRLRERDTPADRAQIRGYAQQYLSHIVDVLACRPLQPLALILTLTLTLLTCSSTAAATSVHAQSTRLRWSPIDFCNILNMYRPRAAR